MEIEGTSEGMGTQEEQPGGGQELDFAQRFERLTHRENQLRQQEKKIKDMGGDLEFLGKLRSGSWRENDDDKKALLQTLGVSDYNELSHFFGSGSKQEGQATQVTSDPTLKRLAERLDAQEEKDRLLEERNRRDQIRQAIENHEGDDFAGLKGLDDLGAHDLIHNFMDHFKNQNGYEIEPFEAAKQIKAQFQDTFSKMNKNTYYAKLAREQLGKSQEANRNQGNNHNTISSNMNARPPAQNPSAWIDDDEASKQRMAEMLGWN